MQELIQGNGSISQLPAWLKRQGVNAVLLVTGHHVPAEKYFTELFNQLTVPHEVIHPPEGVLQLDAIPAVANFDAVVAIGGGKTIDYAKGIIYRHPRPLVFAAAPTTAGSGSEATPIAVFYSGTEKVSLDAPQLLPRLALLDSSLLKNLPAHQKAISGADALAQSIESIWNKHSTPESETVALEGIQLVLKNLRNFVERGEEAAAKEMLWAAHLAGRAITLTRTTGPHALSYYLTANYGVPHGQAVALTLPLFFLFNQDGKTKTQLEKIYRVLRVQSAEEACIACRQLFQQVGLATTLRELGLTGISLDDWLASVNQQRFSNNPVPFDAAALTNLFRRYLC